MACLIVSSTQITNIYRSDFRNKNLLPNSVKSTTAILKDAEEAVSAVKHKRSNDARTAMSVGISILCGENIASQGLQKNIASQLGINRRRIAQRFQHRRSATATLTPWTLIERKTRADATPEEVRRLAYDFWCSPGISRPTGNKRDVARERVAPKEYMEHQKHILEETQTEVFHEFKQKYPDIKMGAKVLCNL